MKRIHRDYCYFLDSGKYNRNWGCKFHDNAYGVRGGGGRGERLAADRALLAHMRGHGDPMAWPTYLGIRAIGWLFFNYTRGATPWRGQLFRKLVRG